MKRSFVIVILVVTMLMQMQPTGITELVYESETIVLSQTDTTPPEIYLHPEDTVYLVGTTGHEFSWAVRDDVDASGGYFIDMQMPGYSTWWPIAADLWYAEQAITINIDGLDPGTYGFRFRAQDWSQNFSNHSVSLIVAAEMDPPEITCSYTIDSDTGRISVDHTVTDASGIATIVTSYSWNHIDWANTTTAIGPGNTVVNGQAGFPAEAVCFRIYAEDIYGMWASTPIYEIERITTTETATTSTTTTTTTNTTTTQEEPPSPLGVMVIAGAGIAGLVIVVLILLRRE